MLPPGLNLRWHHIRLSCDLQRQTEAQRHASNPPCGSENLCKISRVEHVYEMLLWHENVNWLHICCTYAFFGQWSELWPVQIWHELICHSTEICTTPKPYVKNHYGIVGEKPIDKHDAAIAAESATTCFCLCSVIAKKQISCAASRLMYQWPSSNQITHCVPCPYQIDKKQSSKQSARAHLQSAWAPITNVILELNALQPVTATRYFASILKSFSFNLRCMSKQTKIRCTSAMRLQFKPLSFWYFLKSPSWSGVGSLDCVIWAVGQGSPKDTKHAGSGPVFTNPYSLLPWCPLKKWRLHDPNVQISHHLVSSRKSPVRKSSGKHFCTASTSMPVRKRSNHSKTACCWILSNAFQYLASSWCSKILNHSKLKVAFVFSASLQIRMNLKNTGSSHANDAKKFELICESTHVTAKKNWKPQKCSSKCLGLHNWMPFNAFAFREDIHGRNSLILRPISWLKNNLTMPTETDLSRIQGTYHQKHNLKKWLHQCSIDSQPCSCMIWSASKCGHIRWIRLQKSRYIDKIPTAKSSS